MRIEEVRAQLDKLRASEKEQQAFLDAEIKKRLNVPGSAAQRASISAAYDQQKLIDPERSEYYETQQREVLSTLDLIEGLTAREIKHFQEMKESLVFLQKMIKRLEFIANQLVRNGDGNTLEQVNAMPSTKVKIQDETCSANRMQCQLGRATEAEFVSTVKTHLLYRAFLLALGGDATLTKFVYAGSVDDFNPVALAEALGFVLTHEETSLEADNQTVYDLKKVIPQGQVAVTVKFSGLVGADNLSNQVQIKCDVTALPAPRV